MTALVCVCVGWKTHTDESHSLYGLSGIAYVTDCLGDTTSRNFFVGNEDQFHKGDFIGLTMHLDPSLLGAVKNFPIVKIAQVIKDENRTSVQTVV